MEVISEADAPDFHNKMMHFTSNQGLWLTTTKPSFIPRRADFNKPSPLLFYKLRCGVDVVV